MLASVITYQRLGWFWTALLLCGIMFTLWLQAPAAQSAPPVAPLAVAPAAALLLDYASGQVIVKLKPGIHLTAKLDVTTASAAVSTNNAGLQQVLSAIGVSGADPVFTGDRAGMRRSTNADDPLARIYRLALAPDTEVATAVARLRNNTAVEYAEPDYLDRAVLTPNDPVWGNQWALHKINAAAAWDITQGVSSTLYINKLITNSRKQMFDLN